jgi:hypothetical protein
MPSFSRAVPQQYFNVRDYGATGDGVTDDTAAIQAAHNAARQAPGRGTVYFPGGVYVTDTITWNPTATPAYSTVNWVGEGPRNTTIRKKTGNDGQPILNMDFTTVNNPDQEGLLIEGIWFHGISVSTGVAMTGPAVAIKYGARLTFRRTIFYGASVGCQLDGSLINNFHDCQFYVCTTGLKQRSISVPQIMEANINVYRNCGFVSCGTGADHSAGSLPIFDGCVFELNTTRALLLTATGSLQPMAPAVVRNCWFEMNANYHIDVAPDTSTTALPVIVRDSFCWEHPTAPAGLLAAIRVQSRTGHVLVDGVSHSTGSTQPLVSHAGSQKVKIVNSYASNGTLASGTGTNVTANAGDNF